MYIPFYKYIYMSVYTHTYTYTCVRICLTFNRKDNDGKVNSHNNINNKCCRD